MVPVAAGKETVETSVGMRLQCCTRQYPQFWFVVGVEEGRKLAREEISLLEDLSKLNMERS